MKDVFKQQTSFPYKTKISFPLYGLHHFFWAELWIKFTNPMTLTLWVSFYGWMGLVEYFEFLSSFSLFYFIFYFLIQDNFVWITTIFNPSNPIHVLNSLTNILCILKLFSFILEFETYFTYVSYDSFWYSLRLTFDKFWNTLPNYVN